VVVDAQNTQDPGPLTWSTDRVTLAPVRPDDYAFLHWLATSDSIAYRWRYRGAPPVFESFVREVHADVFAQFVVRARADGERIGHVVAYAGDLRNRHVFVANVSAPHLRGHRTGAEAQRLFIGYLFSAFDFRKVYVEVPEFVWSGIEGKLRQDVFEVEGRLREHTFYKGRYWDQLLLAVYRERWFETHVASVGRTHA
jgi:RimJ/RimL family protein N-acetyltransferase